MGRAARTTGFVALLAAAAGVAPAPAAPGALYQQHCAACHGPDGRGDGPAAGLLAPRPRDFTAGRYKFRSTPTGTLPTVDDVVRTIRAGLPGTAMPGYADLLTPAEIAALAREVLALAPAGTRAGRPLDPGAQESPTPEAVARGRALYARAGCGDCHGPAGRGEGWRPEREGPGGPPPPTDLAEPWTFRGGADAGSIAQRILTGLDGSPMPAYADALSAGEARDLAHFVGSLARTPAWAARDPAEARHAGVSPDPLARGRYLANAMLCPLCHTPISPADGSYDTRYFLAGGMRVTAYPWGVWYSRNLTPDPETGLGRWSEADVVRAIRTGIAPDGRRLDPMAMPWPWFSHLTDEDARAIATYLRALPAVRNPVPPPVTTPLAERVGGKLLALAGLPVGVAFWGGNAAVEPGLREGVPAPPALRVGAAALGWTTLLAGVGAVARSVLPRIRGRPGRRRRWLAVGAGALVAWTVLAAWPPFRWMSPAVTSRWLFRGTPALPADLDGAQRAYAERGAYLATIAPCGLCHTPARAFVGFETRRTLAGGMEARWRVYGRVVSTNLTPHPRDGIADVADAVLLRAMHAGVGRDGRRLHWQAMPWDIGSRWTLEDQRAMLAYLRALPPVPGAVPPPRPVRPDDPPADTFYFGDAAHRIR
jgi:mono/diheme cytochrome c family protein